jgi:hypothetical protein
MITLKQFMLTVDYRITEGSDYQWQCFGPNAYCLDSWNGDHNGYTVSIIFDNKDQTVYQAMAYDYANNRAYRMTNPDYKQKFDAECENRAILDMAWEDDNGVPVKYVDLELEEDFLEKARAIINDEDYDTRVQIPVEFSDDELLTYMKMAHDRDMTFNQLVEMALREVIEKNLRDELDDIRLDYDFSEGEQGPVQESIEKIKKKKKGKK